MSKPLPTTTPATSQPGAAGNWTVIMGSSPPDMTFQSTGLMPAAFTFTRTSPGPTLGMGWSVSSSTEVSPYC